jgi:hypothetical protein
MDGAAGVAPLLQPSVLGAVGCSPGVVTADGGRCNTVGIARSDTRSRRVRTSSGVAPGPDLVLSFEICLLCFPDSLTPLYQRWCGCAPTATAVSRFQQLAGAALWRDAGEVCER